MTLLSTHRDMIARLDRVLDAPAGRRAGVLGLGVVGRAMAQHLVRRGCQVVGFDRNEQLDGGALAAAGVDLRLGELPDDSATELDLLCISPGADPRQPVVARAVAAGVPVCGELELCGSLPARVIAITGTNGKSTTTALAGALVRALGKRAFVGGNLGEPVLGWIDSGEKVDVAVLELSSFQLETAYRFRADVAVALNVTPDHTDRYESVEAYALAKQHLLTCVPADGTAILSHDDPRVAAMATATEGRCWWFSTRSESIPGDGVTLDSQADQLMPHGALVPYGPMDLSHPRLLGRHNRENAAAAFLAVCALGLHDEDVGRLRAGYLDFAGLPHRLELIAEVDGVQYINDSKATNDEAASIAVVAMTRPIVLLAGGRDKGGGYDQLLQRARGKVRTLIAFGEARERICSAIEAHAATDAQIAAIEVEACAGMRDAFDAARSRARAGEVVLLAPACSSFDEFTNYAERGHTFAAWVRQLDGACQPGGRR